MILTSGVFDPLHAGHLRFFDRIHEIFLGHELWVVITDDRTRHPPLVPLADRLCLVAKLAGASRVIDSPLMEVLEEDGGIVAAFVKGDEWLGRLPADVVETCRDQQIPIVYVPGTRLNSSSALLADYQRRLNAEKLAAFEAWVATQASAQPWQPVTDYSTDAREAIEAPHADILSSLFMGCSVVDYGCGFGHLINLLRFRGVKATGYDIVRREMAGPARTHVATERWAVPTADVVICREVLEHVRAKDIMRIVRDLVGLARQFVYVTTRFTAKPHLLDFDASDDLNPTHITLLHQDYLRSLFVLQGCRRCPDLEARLDHTRQGRVLVYGVPE